MARSMHVVPFLKRGIHFPSHVAHPNHRLEEVLIRARGLIGQSNVASLHIEDEKPSPVLGHRFGIGQFGSLYPEEMTEYTVHGSEGEGHPTGGAQELTAVHAQVTSLLFGVSNDLLLQPSLLRSLGDGHVLLIGDNLGGHWQVAIEPRIEIRFTDPAIVDLGFRAGRNGLWVGHIHHRHHREFYRPKITAPRLGLQLSMPHFSRMASSST